MWQVTFWSSTPTGLRLSRPHPRNTINHAVSVGVAQALEELDERDDLTVGIITRTVAIAVRAALTMTGADTSAHHPLI